MATLLYELKVKTGEYQDRDGNTKSRWKQIGRQMRNERGPFIVMDRTFNPAGVPGDGDSIMISMFEPRDEKRHQGGGDPARQAPSGGGFDDSIPF